MKRIFKTYALTTFIILFCIQSQAFAALNIFVCEPEWESLANEIGQERVSVYSATKPGEDPHDIDVRPSLIGRLKSADLLFCTGAGLEQSWLPKLIAKADNPKLDKAKPGYLMAADTVTLLEAIGSHETGNHAEGNPHLHLNPHNISQVAKQLLQRLKVIDPGNAASYQHNADRFMQRWQQAIKTWEQRAQPLQGMAIVVNHENWAYLNDWLKLRQVTALESQPGVAPSSAYLAGVLVLIRSLPTQMIVTSAHQEPRAVKWLAGKTGLPIIILPYTVGGNEQAKDLFGLFDSTLDTLLAQQQ